VRRLWLIAAVALPLLAPAPVAADCGGTKHFKARKRLIRGRQPLAIGDSVMLGAAKQLAAAGFEVDVRGCRQMSEGLRVIAARRRAGTLPRIVVIALGSNLAITSSDIRRALRAVGRRRLLGLVTPRKSGGGSGSDSGVIRRAGRRHPGRVKVLDWVRYTAGHGGWFAGDGLHLGPAGAAGMVRLLLRIVPRVHPQRGGWSGTGRTGPVGFSIGRGRVLRDAVLVVDRACLGSRRIELRRSAAGYIPVAGDGSFAVSIGGRGRHIGLRGRFTRRNRVTGFLRVRKRHCDSGRIRWKARPGRPQRRSGGWKGSDADGNSLGFFMPRDRLSLGSSRHNAIRGSLPAPCPGLDAPFSLRRPVPVLAGSFAVRRRLRDGTTVEVRGRFLGSDRAQGSWRRVDPAGACDSGTVAWTAKR
jgi:hypothetical protein